VWWVTSEGVMGARPHLTHMYIHPSDVLDSSQTRCALAGLSRRGSKQSQSHHQFLNVVERQGSRLQECRALT